MGLKYINNGIRTSIHLHFPSFHIHLVSFRPLPTEKVYSPILFSGVFTIKMGKNKQVNVVLQKQ